MKRFLLLLLLLATPARADDFGSITWNSAKGVFQAALHAVGMKDIPDQITISFSPTCSTCASTSLVLKLVKTGGQIMACLSGTVTKNGSNGVFNIDGVPAEFQPTTEGWNTIEGTVGGAWASRGARATGGSILIYADSTYGSWASGTVFIAAGGNGNTCFTYASAL